MANEYNVKRDFQIGDYHVLELGPVHTIDIRDRQMI